MDWILSLRDKPPSTFPIPKPASHTRHHVPFQHAARRARRYCGPCPGAAEPRPEMLGGVSQHDLKSEESKRCAHPATAPAPRDGRTSCVALLPPLCPCAGPHPPTHTHTHDSPPSHPHPHPPTRRNKKTSLQQMSHRAPHRRAPVSENTLIRRRRARLVEGVSPGTAAMQPPSAEAALNTPPNNPLPINLVFVSGCKKTAAALQPSARALPRTPRASTRSPTVARKKRQSPTKRTTCTRPSSAPTAR